MQRIERVTGVISTLMGGLFFLVAMMGSVSASDGELPGEVAGEFLFRGVPNGFLDGTGVMIYDGVVTVWGKRDRGQQGNGEEMVDEMAPPQEVQSFVSRPGLGGGGRIGPRAFNNPRIYAVSGGVGHLLALDEYGDVWGWGQGAYGETGCRVTEARRFIESTPCLVLSGKNIIEIAAGEYFSMARSADGKVFTWGRGDFGQRGDGTLNTIRGGATVSPGKATIYEIPQSAFGGEKVKAIGAAFHGGYAITENNQLYGWGDNEACQIHPLNVCNPGDGAPYNDETGTQTVHFVPTPYNMTGHIGLPNGETLRTVVGGNGWAIVTTDQGWLWGIGLGAALGLGLNGDIDARHNQTGARPINLYYNTGIQVYASERGAMALADDGNFYTWGQQVGGSQYNDLYPDNVTNYIIDYETFPDAIKSIGGGRYSFYFLTHNHERYVIGYDAIYKQNVEPTGQGISFEPYKLTDYLDAIARKFY